MKLNCDLGESYGTWTLGQDAEIMPYIDQASIATGFHAGDPLVIQHTLSLARNHDVEVGAHPAYPDLEGFGRRSMLCSHEEIVSSIHYQIAALDGTAACAGIELGYVKPHGALYNDMMARESVRKSILEALATYHRPLALMLQATPDIGRHREEAAQAGVNVMFEAFADRCYTDNGRLKSRRLQGAVHGHERTLDQVAQLCEDLTVTTDSGQRLPVPAETLCMHGENPDSLKTIREIRAMLDG